MGKFCNEYFSLNVRGLDWTGLMTCHCHLLIFLCDLKLDGGDLTPVDPAGPEVHFLQHNLCWFAQGLLKISNYRPGTRQAVCISHIDSYSGNVKHSFFLSVDPGLKPVELHLVFVPLEAVETLREVVRVSAEEESRVTWGKVCYKGRERGMVWEVHRTEIFFCSTD